MGLFGDQERLLTSAEEKLIREVFKSTDLPPLSAIRIRDGLSPTDTPFTDSDYSIMVGPTLFAGDLAKDDPDTLVHEMVHVWQYKQGTLTRAKAIAAHAGAYMAARFPITRPNRNGPPIVVRPANPNAVEDLYYEYRKRIGDPWNSFTFESQAQLVEDWFSKSGDNKSMSTPRYVYIKKVLYARDVVARRLTVAEMTRPPDSPEPSEIKAPVREIAFETDHFHYFSELIERPLKATDTAGIVTRFKELEAYCRKLRTSRPADAIRLATHLESRGDSLAKSFQYRLSTPTRDKMLKILKGVA